VKNIEMVEQPTMKTGYTYDELMLKHQCTWAQHHHENPRRLSSILDRCRQLKLFDRCLFIPCTQASDDDILLYHNELLLKNLSKAPVHNIDELKVFCQQYEDVYINEVNYNAYIYQ
jgi:acetoin utilization deacetylase AcuC-like enzyme